jgi:phosphoadenosine phosphosulfate reductase
MRITEQDLDHLNRRFEGASPLELLQFTHKTFGDRAGLLSSMQLAGTLLCNLAEKNRLPFDVLFVDTGVLHRETLLTRDELARTHKHLRVVSLHPDQTFAEQTAAEGLLYLSREGQERCCDLRKTQPLLRLKGRYDALVSGLQGVQYCGINPSDLGDEPVAIDFNDRFADLFAPHLSAKLASRS